MPTRVAVFPRGRGGVGGFVETVKVRFRLRLRHKHTRERKQRMRGEAVRKGGGRERETERESARPSRQRGNSKDNNAYEDISL